MEPVETEKSGRKITDLKSIDAIIAENKNGQTHLENIKYTTVSSSEINVTTKRNSSEKKIIDLGNQLQENKKEWNTITKKFLIFVKCYLIPHILVAFFTILVIIFQNLSGKGCFLPPNCLCNNDLGLKFRDTMKDFFFFYMFLVLICISHDVISSKYAKFFILFSMFVFLIIYYLLVDEQMIVDIYIYLFLMVIKVSTEFYFLRKDNNKKEIWKNLLKMNVVCIVVYSNYILYKFVIS